MLWPDRPLQRGPLGRARFIPPWGRAVEGKQLKVVRETTGWGSGSHLQDSPSLCSHLQSLLHFQVQPQEEVSYLEGDSKCMWPQRYLPRWVAIRLHCVTLDCVTSSSSALDRSVRQGPTPTLPLLLYTMTL